jgi:hypothetical protein
MDDIGRGIWRIFSRFAGERDAPLDEASRRAVTPRRVSGQEPIKAHPAGPAPESIVFPRKRSRAGQTFL